MILRLSCGAVKGNICRHRGQRAGVVAAQHRTSFGIGGLADEAEQKIHRVSLSSKRVSLLGKFPVIEAASGVVE
jgi:hypothetical protein